MPSFTERQRGFMGAVLARRRAGKPRPGDPKPSELSTSELREFAGSVKKRRTIMGGR